MAEPPEIEFVFEPEDEGDHHVFAPDLPARDAAIRHLLSIAHGETAYDFAAARANHAEREAGYD
jgi:hypothetical protein